MAEGSRTGHRLIVASLACPAVAWVVHLLGGIQADRMVAAGRGWEMAFYHSPMVFLTADVALACGAGAALAGVVAAPGWRLRLVGAASGLLSALLLAVVPWR